MSATPEQLEQLKAIGTRIDQSQHVIIMSHVSPDPDTVGSALGLAQILRDLGKEVTVLVPTPAMSSVKVLPGWDTVVHDQAVAKQALARAEVVIAVDNTGPRRFGNWKWVLLEAKKRGITTVNLDHHKSNLNFADMNYVETDAPAAGVVVTRLATHMGWAISPGAATDLYAAVSSDTGDFHGRAATWEAFSAGAVLLRAGADRRIVQRMYGDNKLTPAQADLVALAFQARHVNGKVMTVGITQEMLKACGISAEDSKYLLYNLQDISEWDALVVITEKPSGQYAVSVRTRGRVSAIDIAAPFGGGGHPNAAGASFNGGNIDEHLDKMRHQAEKVVARRGPRPSVGEIAA